MAVFVVVDYDEEETGNVGNEFVVDDGVVEDVVADDVVEYVEQYDVMQVVAPTSLGELMT